MNKAMGYRYFPVTAIQRALEASDLFVMAVIDGLREDPAALKKVHLDLGRLAAAWVVEGE